MLLCGQGHVPPCQQLMMTLKITMLATVFQINNPTDAVAHIFWRIYPTVRVVK